MLFHDNLKKSQIVTTEERLSVQVQQAAALQEELRNLRTANEQFR
jgi:hypothetical protein